jgi:hypothetical protein
MERHRKQAMRGAAVGAHAAVSFGAVGLAASPRWTAVPGERALRALGAKAPRGASAGWEAHAASAIGAAVAHWLGTDRHRAAAVSRHGSASAEKGSGSECVCR